MENSTRKAGGLTSKDKCLIGIGKSPYMKRAKCYAMEELHGMSENEIIDCCLDSYPPDKCTSLYCTDATSTTNRCEQNLTYYCTRDQNIATDPRCQQLKHRDLPAFRQIYDKAVNEYCLTNPSIDKMRSSVCRELCAEQPERCDGYLKNMCRNKYPTPQNANHDVADICGCHYDPMVYSSFYDQMSKKIGSPDGADISQPACYYPRCARSSNKPASQCNPWFAQCIEDDTVYENGRTTGNIRVSPSCQIQGNGVGRPPMVGVTGSTHGNGLGRPMARGH